MGTEGRISMAAVVCWGALCAVLVVLSSASVDGDTPINQYQKGFASGNSVAKKAGQETAAPVKRQVAKLEAAAQVREVKIATLEGQAAAAGGQMKDMHSKIATKDAKISKLETKTGKISQPSPVCALYKEPKQKKNQLKLKRTMDQRVAQAVQALKSDPEFKKWVQKKPMDDLRTAKLLRNQVFRKYRAANKRTKEVTQNYQEMETAMFGRARGLVSNRMSFSNAMSQFALDSNKAWGKSVSDYRKGISVIGTTSPSKLLKFVKETARNTAKLGLRIRSTLEIKNLPGNTGFQIYRASIENQILAELSSFKDDMAGNHTSGRQGVRPLKIKQETVRDQWMKLLVNMTLQEGTVMRNLDLLGTFPIPDQVDVSKLVCVNSTRMCKHPVEVGQVCKVFSGFCGKYTVGIVKESAKGSTHWKKWGANSPDKPKALRKALTPTEGGAQWSCQRVTGDSKKMQSSYECTLLDYGANGLGFVGFKGSTRLIPTEGKKTCVRWSRTKDKVLPKMKVCCPEFKCKPSSGCGKAYNKALAETLYTAKTKKCHKDLLSNPKKPETSKCLDKMTRSKCAEKMEDCLSALEFGRDIAKKNYETRNFKGNNAASPKSLKLGAQYCESMWKNSRIGDTPAETDATDPARLLALLPMQLADVKIEFKTEKTDKDLPPGVMAKPYSCNNKKDTKGGPVHAYWPDQKWGLGKATRLKYCGMSECQELYPQLKGCEVHASVLKMHPGDKGKFKTNTQFCLNKKDEMQAFWRLKSKKEKCPGEEKNGENWKLMVSEAPQYGNKWKKSRDDCSLSKNPHTKKRMLGESASTDKVMGGETSVEMIKTSTKRERLGSTNTGNTVQHVAHHLKHAASHYSQVAAPLDEFQKAAIALGKTKQKYRRLQRDVSRLRQIAKKKAQVYLSQGNRLAEGADTDSTDLTEGNPCSLSFSFVKTICRHIKSIKRRVNSLKKPIVKLKNKMAKAAKAVVKASKKAAAMLRKAAKAAANLIKNRFGNIGKMLTAKPIKIRASGYIFKLNIMDPKTIVTAIGKAVGLIRSRLAITSKAQAWDSVRKMDRQLVPPVCKVQAAEKKCQNKRQNSTPIPELSTLEIDLEGQHKCIKHFSASRIALSKIVHCPLAPYQYKMSGVTFSTDGCMVAKSCSGSVLQTHIKDKQDARAHKHAEGLCSMY